MTRPAQKEDAGSWGAGEGEDCTKIGISRHEDSVLAYGGSHNQIIGMAQ